MKKEIIVRIMDSIIRKSERTLVNKVDGGIFYIWGRFTAYREPQRSGILVWDGPEHNSVMGFATLLDNGRTIVG